MKNEYLIILVFLFFGCNSKNEFWDVNHFEFNDKALKDGENISLLYASRAPDYKNEDYYVHYVVISDLSGDTVNVLSNINYHLTDRDDGLDFVFHSDNKRTGKSLELDHEKYQNTTLDTNFLNNLETKICNKVIRDSHFDHIADNKYPTIKGKIMKIMKVGETVEDFLNSTF